MGIALFLKKGYLSKDKGTNMAKSVIEYIKEDGCKAFIIEYKGYRFDRYDFNDNESLGIKDRYKDAVYCVIMEHTLDDYKEVLCRRFGLLSYNPTSIRDIATLWNAPEHQVRNLYNRAMQSLRLDLEVKTIINEGLDFYIDHKNKEQEMINEMSDGDTASLDLLVKLLRHIKIWEMSIPNDLLLKLNRGPLSGPSIRSDSSAFDLLMMDDDAIKRIRGIGTKGYFIIDQIRWKTLKRCSSITREELIDECKKSGYVFV